jgi:hypothetical protein
MLPSHCAVERQVRQYLVRNVRDKAKYAAPTPIQMQAAHPLTKPPFHSVPPSPVVRTGYPE